MDVGAGGEVSWASPFTGSQETGLLSRLGALSQYRTAPLRSALRNHHPPAMSTRVLEQTITALQRRVTRIESRMSQPREGWRKIAGAAKDDHHFAEAMRLGAKWRKQANREDW